MRIRAESAIAHVQAPAPLRCEPCSQLSGPLLCCITVLRRGLLPPYPLVRRPIHAILVREDHRWRRQKPRTLRVPLCIPFQVEGTAVQHFPVQGCLVVQLCRPGVVSALHSIHNLPFRPFVESSALLDVLLL